AQFLRNAGIKEGKAYYWLAEYEKSIGVRKEDAPVDPAEPAPLTFEQYLNLYVSRETREKTLAYDPTLYALYMTQMTLLFEADNGNDQASLEAARMEGVIEDHICFEPGINIDAEGRPFRTWRNPDLPKLY